MATFDTVREIALSLPGVEEGTSYGTAAFRVRGKFLARLREGGEATRRSSFGSRRFREALSRRFWSRRGLRWHPRSCGADNGEGATARLGVEAGERRARRPRRYDSR